MTIKSKKEQREKLLESLQEWHSQLGIDNFPRRFGISTNEKKFREISFRVEENIPREQATVDDIVVSKQAVYGLNHNVVGYIITYRVWLPALDGKFPGFITVRFSLNISVIGIVKVGEFFIAVEHDNIPLQNKTVGLARMYGVTDSENLAQLAGLLLEKEYPFLIDSIVSYQVTQLGNTLFQDPSSRQEESLYLLIDLKLDEEIKSKEKLADYLDHRNKEMLLHHIYSEKELKKIVDKQMQLREVEDVQRDEGYLFRDNYSLWALATYFYSKK